MKCPPTDSWEKGMISYFVGHTAGCPRGVGTESCSLLSCSWFFACSLSPSYSPSSWGLQGTFVSTGTPGSLPRHVSPSCVTFRTLHANFVLFYTSVTPWFRSIFPFYRWGCNGTRNQSCPEEPRCCSLKKLSRMWEDWKSGFTYKMGQHCSL